MAKRWNCTSGCVAAVCFDNVSFVLPVSRSEWPLIRGSRVDTLSSGCTSFNGRLQWQMSKRLSFLHATETVIEKIANMNSTYELFRVGVGDGARVRAVYE